MNSNKVDPFFPDGDIVIRQRFLSQQPATGLSIICITARLKNIAPLLGAVRNVEMFTSPTAVCFISANYVKQNCLIFLIFYRLFMNQIYSIYINLI
jgi:hypothetical protein